MLENDIDADKQDETINIGNKEQNKSNDKNDEVIRQIVEDLCSVSLNEEDSQKILEKLHNLYKDNKEYRHRYDEITQTILQVKENITNYGEQGNLMNAAENMRIIWEQTEKSKDFSETKSKIKKLFVHINLECIRLQNLEYQLETINKETNQIKDNIEKTNKNAQEIQKNLDKQQTQYITILGIFASIVLAFVGGLAFSTSVLSNIHQSGIFKLTFVMCFIALFIGNILFSLFSFLSKIALKEKQKSTTNICLFNVVIVIFMIVAGSCYYCKEYPIDSQKTMTQENNATSINSKIK